MQFSWQGESGFDRSCQEEAGPAGRDTWSGPVGMDRWAVLEGCYFGGIRMPPSTRIVSPFM